MNLDQRVDRKFFDRVFVQFFLLAWKYFRQVKSYGLGPEFVLVSNMDLEILCQFLFENRQEISAKLKKLVWTDDFFAYFYIFSIAIRN
jgi:hypothetical protein